MLFLTADTESLVALPALTWERSEAGDCSAVCGARTDSGYELAARDGKKKEAAHQTLVTVVLNFGNVQILDKPKFHRMILRRLY